jgi:hypothetical protein
MKRLAGVLVILLCLAVMSSACVFTEANQSQAEKPNVLQSSQPSSTTPGQAVLEDGTPVKLRIGRTGFICRCSRWRNRRFRGS